MDPIYDLADNFLGTNYEDLTEEAIDAAKREVLDGIGVAVAGSRQAGVQELIEILKMFGGEGQSHVILAGVKLPVIHAAQANATMIHALDYDDTINDAVCHPGSIVVSTCLAMADYLGGVNGRNCLTVIALGADLMNRMGLATRHEISRLRAGWHFTPLYGVFASAAIAGRLLGLDRDRLINALGIAYHQAAGNMQCIIDGALTKRMGPGFAVRNGIMAALMAEKGITGAKNIIEGEHGIYQQYNRGGYDRETLLKDLGKAFGGVNLTIKPYPCCQITHSFIDAALGLAKEHDIQPEQVNEIRIFAGEGGYFLSTPLDIKSNPREPVDAQFSIPWVVSVALANRKVSIGDFTRQAIKEKKILNLSNKVKVELDRDLSKSLPEPGRVQIKTGAGTYTKQVDYAYGGPRNPMTFEGCAKKFRDCASYAPRLIPDEVVENIVGSVSHMEKLDNVGKIVQELE